jgi:hypothetical protein
LRDTPSIIMSPEQQMTLIPPCTEIPMRLQGA